MLGMGKLKCNSGRGRVLEYAKSSKKKSSTGICHVKLRGINRQSVLLDDEDNEKFLQTADG